MKMYAKFTVASILRSVLEIAEHMSSSVSNHDRYFQFLLIDISKQTESKYSLAFSSNRPIHFKTITLNFGKSET